MWVLVMVLVEYGSNAKWVEGMGGGLNNLSFRLDASSSETTTCNTPIFWAWAIRNLIMSPVITVHTLRKKWEIKTVPILTRFSSSLIPWRSWSRWLNRWCRENAFGVDCWDSCTQKKGGGKLLRYRGRDC